jgi:hypothetical protein
MTDHRILVSSETHEPKHITNSTAADAGKVITPSAGGASILRKLLPEEVGVRIAFGEAGVDANTGTFALSAAADSTLYDTADYVALNSARIANVVQDEAVNTTFDAVNNTITPAISGYYIIRFWMNVSTTAVSNIIGVKAKNDGTWTNFTVKNESKDANRTVNMSGFIIKQLVAGEPVSLHMASEKVATVNISDFRFDVIMLQEV